MPKIHINEERLILEVQKHPCLYNIDSKHYKDAEMANNAWSAIGTVCDASAADCKARWKSLRDRYVRNKREQKTKSGQSTKSKRPWKYAEIMSFLDRYMPETETVSNLVLPEDDEQEDQRAEDITPEPTDVALNMDDGDDVSISTTSTETRSNSTITTAKQTLLSNDSTYVRSTKRTKKQVDDPVGIAMLKYLQRENTDAKERELDEDESFLQSQVPVLRRLPQRKKAEVKFLIHEILYKAEWFPDMQLTLQVAPPYQVHIPGVGPPRQLASNMNLMTNEWDLGDPNRSYTNL